jgi:LemA protein
MVSLDEDSITAWSQVENVYQRRADLIPNLVNTVKGYASHEKETLTAVIEARAKATSTTIDPSNMTMEQIQQFQANQDMLSNALSKLMVVIERYPELKANENFLSLQAELAGTENRITVERKNFNEITKKYNKKIRRFPSNLWANLFGFERRNTFEAKEGSDVAPTVEF